MKKINRFMMGTAVLLVSLLITACGTAEGIKPEPIEDNSMYQEQESAEEISEPEEAEPEKTPESGEPSSLESISGNIETIEDGSFTISKYLITQPENGGEISVNRKEEADKVKVTYSDSTQFIVCTSTDGMTGEYTDGTADDLQTGKTAELEGVYEGSEFKAQKVTIYIILH